VAVYSASSDFGYSLNREILRPASVGETLEPLGADVAGVWSGRTLRVRLASGSLQSVGPLDVMQGANAAALRFGGVGDWEVLQFRTATLVGPDEYLLGGLLRGQAGTDGVMPEVWPTGSDFVLLDGAPVQLDQPASLRATPLHYRIGPAARGYDDPSYVHRVESFAGVGLRPFRPSHLKARELANGDLEISWIRRARIDGDGWEGFEPPLGEDREAYLVRIRHDGGIVRVFQPSGPMQAYSAEQRAQDGSAELVEVEVAQVSGRFGLGPFARLNLAESRG